MTEIEFILYVADQQKSTSFYEYIFQLKPTLNVPGMTEFSLAKHIKLGLMPENGIAKIISGKLPHPKEGNGIPRCELYLKVDNPQVYLNRCLEMEATEVSPLKKRDWGDTVGYIADLDGHIIAFAKSNKIIKQ